MNEGEPKITYGTSGCSLSQDTALAHMRDCSKWQWTWSE